MIRASAGVSIHYSVTAPTRFSLWILAYLNMYHLKDVFNCLYIMYCYIYKINKFMYIVHFFIIRDIKISLTSYFKNEQSFISFNIIWPNYECFFILENWFLCFYTIWIWIKHFECVTRTRAARTRQFLSQKHPLQAHNLRPFSQLRVYNIAAVIWKNEGKTPLIKK